MTSCSACMAMHAAQAAGCLCSYCFGEACSLLSSCQESAKGLIRQQVLQRRCKSAWLPASRAASRVLGGPANAMQDSDEWSSGWALGDPVLHIELRR